MAPPRTPASTAASTPPTPQASARSSARPILPPHEVGGEAGEGEAVRGDSWSLMRVPNRVADYRNRPFAAPDAALPQEARMPPGVGFTYQTHPPCNERGL